MNGDDAVFDDVYLVDDEGNALPDNAETSALIAATYGEDVDVHDDTDEWYLEGMRESHKLRDELRKCMVENHRPPPAVEDDRTRCPKGSPTDEVDDECGEDVGDDDMGNPSYSREYSDGGEWVLESLVSRRKLKRRRNVTTTNTLQQPSEFDHDDVERLLASCDYEYECRWKWYRETTWESRTVLEDMGYGERLNAFDAAKRMPSTSTPSDEGLKRLRASGSLSAMFHHAFVEAGRLFHTQGMHITRYASVDFTSGEDKLMRLWNQSSDNHCLQVLFHGTHAKNLASIAKRGLMVPTVKGGTGIRVLTGSAFGVGVYSAKDPQFSVFYTRKCNCMFVCLGLIGPQYTTVKETGRMCVFFDAAQIVPIWLVEFAQGEAPTTDFKPLRCTLRELSRVPEHVQQTNHGAQQRVSFSAPVTKRMMKQMPRTIKALYQEGSLKARRTN